MLPPQVWRAMRWQPVINTDYDGAVLVGGLENELRHFGDPDEEHDFWGDPPPAKPCPYTHEGARAIAAAKKKRKQQQLRVAREASIIGISQYEGNASDEDFDEAIVENEEEQEEEDGCTIEGNVEPLEFHDEWFGGDMPEDYDEHEVGLEDCSQCGGQSKGQIDDDNEEADDCGRNAEEIITGPIKDIDIPIDEDIYASDLDLTQSFIFMFDEELETKGDAKEMKNKIPSTKSSKDHCLCQCGDSAFVEIDNKNKINGLNGMEKTPCPARAVIAAQPGIWRAMTACRPFERARRPHIVRPGSWQAV
ncbi:hypothetical protein SBOR_9238 [Sclerotinia borealis F-4128]|uniref:Uncharacterized protein n=1 Tax=Sclerotinia borealis (strain F-4128) TaxID=1432307 RepID=W9C3E3_SCLBF|nr:hypothetical protein SBOR_9238 [Sclerotinia borealis F-4128]